MLTDGLIIGVALGYLGLLFGIAYYGDRRAEAGRSLIANPYVYTLSIAVYCTAWTFYGSVGRAAETGMGFLPIYLGPTLMMVLAWLTLRRIVRITKTQRITSIADFIASRYGKSQLLGGLVTVIAVIGILPYISIQLEAIATSFTVLSHYPEVIRPEGADTQPLWLDTSFHAALLLIVFTILFGTRHIETTERHEGLVAAVAFESLVKLLAFLAIGVFVGFVMFAGPGEIFTRAAEQPELQRLFSMEAVPGGYGGWLTLVFLACMAFLFLPRQFQILVVENVDESHLRTASWLFPLYLLVINLFVLPIALAGLLVFDDQPLNGDTLVLALPILEQQPLLALLVFIGGLSAATGMVIVETVALSTMVCNDLIMPVLLRLKRLHLDQRSDLSRLLLTIRRISIAVMIVLGDLFFRTAGGIFPLVTIGLLSFAAAAQFAPAILLGLFWHRANRTGALIGLSGGFLLWVYTLLLPISGWLPESFVTQGPWGIGLLRPRELFGLEGLDLYTHGVFWSMLANVGGLMLGSLLTQQGPVERVQASRFVDVFHPDRVGAGALIWRGSADVIELRRLVARFLGVQRAERAFADYAHQRGLSLEPGTRADAALVHHAERLLAGAIGAASARVMVGSIVKGEPLSLSEVMTILDESSQAIRYSRELEQKSRELEAAYTELREANERLKELDRMKDEFVATVSHELRTPLTSIRAFSEILLGNSDMTAEQRDEFLGIIVKESERLTRLINQVLDMAKMDAGRIEWHMERIELQGLIRDAANATSQLCKDRGVRLETELGEQPVELTGDSDRLTQVIINLLSNATRFCPEDSGRVTIRLRRDDEHARIEVQDNGPGIPPEQIERIFERFHQVSDQQAGKPEGTGLGLTISQRIVEHHGGSIWAESGPGQGATFILELPLQAVPRTTQTIVE